MASLTNKPLERTGNRLLLLSVFSRQMTKLLIPKRMRASWKWFLSPIVAALFTASLVAYVEDYQFTHYCSQVSDWRIDTLGKLFLINWIIVLIVFTAWAAVRYVREGRRLQ